MLKKLLDSDIGYSFRSSPVAIGSSVIASLCVLGAALSGLIAPHNPFDLASLILSDARLPPAWSEGGSWRYILGTDDQGRDMLSAILYGMRISLLVSIVSVALSVLIG
ncbi:MAG: ABC transporter permease, partial [Betaproteobacteria bacterium]